MCARAFTLCGQANEGHLNLNQTFWDRERKKEESGKEGK